MVFRASGLALLVLLLAACGSLNSEPRIVSTLPARDLGVASPHLPASSTSDGARLFRERCSPCHGDGGRGDGPLVRASQIAAPPDFTQPATMTVRTLQEIFDVITNGRIEKMMPPWGGALSEAERWTVVEFVAGLGGGAAATPRMNAP
ncbi:MAG: cytochrome c [Anaerolineae bacterium]|nr:cytochrome c [Anaerolineae bacterium]